MKLGPDVDTDKIIVKISKELEDPRKIKDYIYNKMNFVFLNSLKETTTFSRFQISNTFMMRKNDVILSWKNQIRIQKK